MTDYPVPILKYFEFGHLPEKLQMVSSFFHKLAWNVVSNVPDGPERSVALRKILEGKDAAVRAALS